MTSAVKAQQSNSSFVVHWNESIISTGAELSKNGSTVPLSSIEKRCFAADGNIIRVSSRGGRQLIVDPACHVL